VAKHMMGLQVSMSFYIYGHMFETLAQNALSSASFRLVNKYGEAIGSFMYNVLHHRQHNATLP
jgi:hypothetical protein